MQTMQRKDIQKGKERMHVVVLVKHTLCMGSILYITDHTATGYKCQLSPVRHRPGYKLAVTTLTMTKYV